MSALELLLFWNNLRDAKVFLISYYLCIYLLSVYHQPIFSLNDPDNIHFCRAWSPLMKWLSLVVVRGCPVFPAVVSRGGRARPRVPGPVAEACGLSGCSSSQTLEHTPYVYLC